MHTINTKCPSFAKANVRNETQLAPAINQYINVFDFDFPAEPQSSLISGGQKPQISSAAHQKQQELLKQVAEQQFVPKEPPPDFEFIADPPSISALDL